jgi:hypothetical protein
MKQLTLAAVGFERYAKTTGRAAFLAEMERVVPWSALCALIEPSEARQDRMVGAIREFGFRIPIVAESDGSVVDGHLRLKAARKQQVEFEFAEPGEREVEAERVQVAEFER